MSIQIIDQPLTALGGFGKELASGLSETMPKGIERGMLSRGLQDLQKQPNLSMLDMASKVMALPGGKEAFPMIQPYLSIERARRAALGDFEGQQEPITGQQAPITPSVSPQPQEEGTSRPISLGDFQTIDENRPSFGQQRDPALIQAFAAQNMKRTGRTFDEELKVAEGRFKTLEDREQKFIQNKSAFETDFDNRMKRITQAESFKDVPGEMQARMLSKGYEKLKTLADPVKVSEEMGKEVEDFMKVRSKLREAKIGKDGSIQPIGPKRIRTLFQPGAMKNSLSAAKENYMKRDEGELFINDLIGFKGFSRPYASRFTFPPSQGVERAINSKTSGDAKYQEILDNMTAKDSLNSIATELNLKRNPKSTAKGFLEYVSNKSQEAGLTEFQSRELINQPRSFEPGITDIIYFTMLGRKI